MTDRLSVLKTATSAALASGATIAVTEFVKARNITDTTLIIVLVIAAPALAAAITWLTFAAAVHTAFGRRLILGRSWVEGWWHIVTYEGTELSSVVAPGLMHVEYTPPDLAVNTVVYRPSSTQPAGNRVALPVTSRSTSSSVRAHDMQLINYCTFPLENTEGKALGIGNFLVDDKSYPTRYEGYLLRLNDGVYRRQAAVKVSRRQIASARKTFGANWIANLLQSLHAERDGLVERADATTTERIGQPA